MASRWKAPLREAAEAKAFVLAIYDDGELFQQSREEIIRRIGKVDYETPEFSAELRESEYDQPRRRLARALSFRRPIGREELVDMRRRCLAIEARRQRAGAPLVELECGYVTLYQVVRTTISEDFHRIYLYSGIFAEACLYFEKLSFRPFLYTSAFLRQQECLSAFNDIRLILLSGDR